MKTYYLRRRHAAVKGCGVRLVRGGSVRMTRRRIVRIPDLNIPVREATRPVVWAVPAPGTGNMRPVRVRININGAVRLASHVAVAININARVPVMPADRAQAAAIIIRRAAAHQAMSGRAEVVRRRHQRKVLSEISITVMVRLSVFEPVVWASLWRLRMQHITAAKL